MKSLITPAILVIFFLNILVACDKASPNLHGIKNQPTVVQTADTDGDSPLKLVGERLFRETRFSEYFYEHAQGILNKPPAQGDPVVETLDTITRQLDNPYRGQAISCAACHFVDQMRDVPGIGVRAYTDLSRRSRVPARDDGQTVTPRNSMNMVGSALHDGMFLHNDGEFITAEDLVRGTYLGRNMGWYVGDDDKVIRNMAQVIRLDDGSFPTETDLGGLSYRDLLAGAKNIPPRFLIPNEYRIDVTKAKDSEVFDAVVKLVGGYLRSLDYARDANGHYNGSPYDAFLRKNNLPLAPQTDESNIEYSQRLAEMVSNLKNAVFIRGGEKTFALQKQDFIFTEKELKGMQVFFGKGQCIQCHSAPDFTDHLFHNTGVSQDDYENVHGEGSFAKLSVPTTLAARNARADIYLPASPRYPHALAKMKSPPSKTDADMADLGAWVVFGNPAMPKPQTLLRQAICESVNIDCAKVSDDEVLNKSLGLIKTPTTRDLGQSDPYLHTGRADRIEDVLNFYIKYSAMARAGQVRNGDFRLKSIDLSPEDVDSLTLFLKSLNEDYD